MSQYSLAHSAFSSKTKNDEYIKENCIFIQINSRSNPLRVQIPSKMNAGFKLHDKKFIEICEFFYLYDSSDITDGAFSENMLTARSTPIQICTYNDGTSFDASLKQIDVTESVYPDNNSTTTCVYNLQNTSKEPTEIPNGSIATFFDVSFRWATLLETVHPVTGKPLFVPNHKGDTNLVDFSRNYNMRIKLFDVCM
jgi:hypothetical protein